MERKLDLVITNLEIERGEVIPALYENCAFSACHLNAFNLCKFVFVDCTFDQCDLSSINVCDAAFRNVEFSDCKMLGIRFDECNKVGFKIKVSRSSLRYSTFTKMKLENVQFEGCNLDDVEFIECDLKGAIFNKSNLLNTYFETCDLTQSDFRNARNYAIDIEINKINKSKHDRANLLNLLGRYKLDIE